MYDKCFFVLSHLRWPHHSNRLSTDTNLEKKLKKSFVSHSTPPKGSFTKDVCIRGGGVCMAYADAGGRGEDGGLCRCGRPILNHLSILK